LTAKPPRYGNWGWGRNDACDYARLALMFQCGMQPVRPEGPNPARTPGQLSLFLDSDWAAAARRLVDEEAPAG
jgi:hypothetical protein